MLAGVVSDAFDPALELDDDKSATLAKNDDRADGEQSPFISYRATREGNYVLKVLSYRSISGGKFTIRLRTFSAIDPGLGKQTTNEEASVDLGSQQLVLIHLSGRKDTAYQIEGFEGKNGRNYYGASGPTFYGPSGYRANDFTHLIAPDGRIVFIALKDGDYYFEYQFYNLPKKAEIESNIHEIAFTQVTTSSQATLDLSKGSLQIVSMPVKANDVVETTMPSKRTTYTASFQDKPDIAESIYNTNEDYANLPDWTWFREQRHSDQKVIRSFHRDGNLRFVIELDESAKSQSFKNSEKIQNWEDKSSIKETLEIGESKIFLLKPKKSELMHVQAMAEHFEPKFEIISLAGEVENTLLNPITHKPGDDLYFPNADSFLIRFSCDGDGGSGAFSLERNSPAPETYKLGSAQKLEFTGTNFGYYSIELEGGKQYELLYDNTQLGLRADLLDDDGTFLTSQYINFGNIGVQYFTPQHKGHYRLWLRGGPGTRTFKFQVHVIPTLKS